MIGGILGALYGSGILGGHSSMGGAAPAEEMNRRQFEAARQCAHGRRPGRSDAMFEAMRARATANANADRFPVTIDVEGEVLEDRPLRQ